ncbi:hypothetical protein PSMEN_00435 [Ectopseudomonas mendocina]|nr:hypothetical protein PSMEN_00435 [Pseudomonas mendocina]
MISERADLDLASLLHQRAFLAFSPNGDGIHGLIHRVEQGESGKRLTRYRLAIVPQLAYLTHRTNQRIFQNLTVPQIVAQVLEEHGNVEGGYLFQHSVKKGQIYWLSNTSVRKIIFPLSS